MEYIFSLRDWVTLRGFMFLCVLMTWSYAELGGYLNGEKLSPFGFFCLIFFFLMACLVYQNGANHIRIPRIEQNKVAVVYKSIWIDLLIWRLMVVEWKMFKWSFCISVSPHSTLNNCVLLHSLLQADPACPGSEPVGCEPMADWKLYRQFGAVLCSN